MYVQPYVFFNGRCEEALAYYTEQLGAEVTVKMRYSEAPPDPNNPQRPELADKIMHASIRMGSTVWMASDGNCDPASGSMNGFSLTLTTDDAPTAKTYFDALAAGGQVMMPFQPTFWSTGFGMVVDRFGLMWMVSEPERPAGRP
ncbi:VOC family protein [Burkholderia sp. SRS-W-2-2016]|uniref:VOC family protein n=1 Tax=Burkholderia sp. SRS-W-2-2016 TaxID=1926878 RepID=UPI00094AD9F7|nr:VOC family protein [Burkholderia sp. SRS-W-2-2016]OLL32858.1 VOC family protein [Burkholderia sp. SRS-W-2-2016]